MSFDYASVFVFLAKDVGVWLFFCVRGKTHFFPPLSITVVVPGYIMLLFLSLLFWNVFHLNLIFVERQEKSALIEDGDF